MKEIKVLKDDGKSYWAKKGHNEYSRSIKDLLDYLGLCTITR